MSIIILNGPTSSGKTSIYNKLSQQDLNNLWINFGIDTFYGMLSPAHRDNGNRAEEVTKWVSEQDQNGSPVTRIKISPFGQKYFSCMPKVIRSLAEQGFSVVVDEVFEEPATLLGYLRAFQGIKIYFIGVTCNLETLEVRERERGDRPVGLARQQYNRVHWMKDYYDIIVNTSTTSKTVCANSILEFIKQTNKPQGFDNCRETFISNLSEHYKHNLDQVLQQSIEAS